MRTYKATIIPTINGGNIEVRISANSVYQAQELIKTLPYFKSFIRMPFVINENEMSQAYCIDNDNNNINELISLDELDID